MKATQKTTDKGITLDPIEANWSIGNNYIIELNKITQAMTKDVLQKMELIYKRDEAELEMILDSSPVNTVDKSFKELLDKWQKIFNKHSALLSRSFVNDVDQDVQRKLKTSFDKYVKEFTVSFDQSNKKALWSKQAVIKENISLIKSIPDKARVQMQYSVNEAMQRGRDWKYLQERIMKVSDVAFGVKS